ncbi:MAG: 3-dehydroquinate synthase [Oscillospiraceae bacterium]|nr:3-dehydroquinate synthase [Oscillospiraceae bacterium]
MTTVTVEASKKYNVLIGAGLLEKAGELAAKVITPCTAAVVTDDTVDALYFETLRKSLEKTGYTVVKFTIPHGEMSKNTENYVAILNFLAESHLTRSDVIFALGGGVVGDLAGFASASFLRGVRLVQIPTTLLSAVDSSVGGKTAINLDSGKNLAGAFYQPDLVVCDTNCLETLPKEQISNGMAEVIKYGFIRDGEFLDILQQGSPDWENVIARCVSIKRDIVNADEFDTGERQLLNFGHTLAHAVEKCSNYEIYHGAAVAVGMVMISRACAKKGICGEEILNRVIELNKLYGLPAAAEFTAEELFNAVLSDKKRSGGKINLVVPEKMGKCVLMSLDMASAKELLALGV